jgi:hypothetical protein
MQAMFKPLLTDLYNSGYDFKPLDSDAGGDLDHFVTIHSGYPAEYGADDCTGNTPENRIWRLVAILFHLCRNSHRRWHSLCIYIARAPRDLILPQLGQALTLLFHCHRTRSLGLLRGCARKSVCGWAKLSVSIFPCRFAVRLSPKLTAGVCFRR